MNEPEHGTGISSNLTPDDLSCPGDVPVAERNRIAAQRALNGLRRMPAIPCFSYSADAPLPDLRRMPAAACFSYPADRPLRDLQRMPAGSCFNY
jgi:hypothetical protein